MTHSELVGLAAKWLARRCSVVVTELVTQSEEPDALGWGSHGSTLVECKASLSDYRADASKPFRIHEGMGVGNERYYLAPEGLIDPESLPPKWGLLEARPDGRLRVVRKSGRHEPNTGHECRLLLSCLRRVGQACPAGVSIRCYSIPTKNRATLGVEPPEQAEDYCCQEKC